MIEERPYQNDIIAKFMRTTAEFKRIILVAPAGSGKTVIGGSIIKEYVARHHMVLVLCHRAEIINQTIAKLRELGLWVGIIWAEADRLDVQPLAPVQVASIPTLHARAIRTERMQLPDANLVVVDEAHHVKARTWREILDAYRNATILGLTATPCRGGRGLGGIFETMIECPQVAQLIELGYLVPSRVYAPAAPNLGGVETRQGDYVVSQLEERLDKAQLVADIVTTWLKYGEGRKTVVFATGVGHSIHIRNRFIEAGIKAEHIDGGTPKDERDATLARLASGEIDVVCNCMVLTEGWDMPEVGCCILARPTKQMGLFRQMIGRVLRPAPGKNDADHP
jgi:DNA repair protein RadD